MSEITTLDIFHIFLFIIPGFITVWSFRYLTNSKKSADFEYFSLSIFWGIIMVFFYGLISKKETFNKLISNPYLASIVLSIFGFIISLLGKIINPSWKTFLKKFNKIYSKFKSIK